MCSLAEGIEYKGILKGRVEGKAEGKAEGIIEGQLSLLLNQINNHIITKEDAFKCIDDDNLKEELIKRLDNKSTRGI